ncbi:MAG: PLP-dependent transferase [Candidatus Velamenicoccus archaeovorus]
MVRLFKDAPDAVTTGVLDTSFLDLAEDFDELASLSGSMSSRLVRTGRELLRARGHLHGDTLDLLEDQLRWFRSTYDRLRREQVGLRWEAGRGRRSLPLLEGLAERKRAHADHLRSLQSSAAALITASDWQSPSYDHAVSSMAGRHTGRVTEHVDDYKRDRHPDAAAFEQAYLREYVDAARALGLRALMTGCGMSAFATILAYLTMERLVRGPVLLGASVYHECRDLIARSELGPLVHEVPEMRTDLIQRAIDELRPDAVFLDSLCNAKGIHLPDLPRIVEHLGRNGDRCTLVVDNTGLSCSLQPFSLLSPETRTVRLIVFESLTKYAQLGLDRTAAGMIVAGAEDGAAMDGYREHLGTNVADAVVWTVPEPNRGLLMRRLRRIGRNASLLACRLHREAAAHPGVLLGVSHPSLPDHPSHDLAGALPFPGGFLSLDFVRSMDRTEVHRRFVRLALDEAGRRHVPLAAGASFGFDTTRVYVTATTATAARPFVRIAAGTEHLHAAETMAETLASAIAHLDR